jgi:ATPase subunit of ABC transporter with duplicated ATPase domains
VFVSHDREFVSGLANRIIEIQPGGGIIDHRGSYDEYLAERGQR